MSDNLDLGNSPSGFDIVFIYACLPRRSADRTGVVIFSTSLDLEQKFSAMALHRIKYYLVPERKLGFFVKIKEDENFNHRNTGSISRIKI